MKITNSTATGNTYGIVSSGPAATLTGDHGLNNTSTGLYLGGTATVTSNVANGNGVYGIWDASAGNTLKTNTANNNGNDGIFANQNDPKVIDGGGNTAKGNDTTTGTKPEQCYGVVCN